jgi:hypothetical protein
VRFDLPQGRRLSSSEPVEMVDGSHRLCEMKITTRKIGGIWHGYLEGHPEIDERALTEEIARQKVKRILDTWMGDDAVGGQERTDES